MRVLVAGGGIAALEALAGLNALAGDRVEATLLDPDGRFSYRPLSGAVPFTFRDERVCRLDELAAGMGAAFVRDGLADVDMSRARVLTNSGDFLPYDVLLVAIGARLERRSRRMERFTRKPDGLAALAGLLRDLESGSARRAAFVVPSGAAWPVDAYELAFAARLAGPEAELTIATSEERPLAALGTAASEVVADELAKARIEVVTGVEVRDRTASGSEGGMDAFSSVIARLTRRRAARGRRSLVLPLEPEGRLVVDRALCLPRAHGPAVAGLPHDERGFLAVDAHSRVAEVERVFAAGDATALPLKHSTLAAAQATAAAHAIAAQAGADVEAEAWSSTLYGILTLPPHFPGERGSPWLADGEPASHCLWWPPGHVAGRYLAPFLASRDRGVRPGLEWHPNGLPVAVHVEASSPVETSAPSSDEALRHDALSRQLMAIRRTEREGESLGRELGRELADFDRHEREVVKRLKAAGYLRD